jgi:broad specificity phosphatase PhoE
MSDTDPQTAPGYITIARHGEPDANRRERLGWQAYEDWWAGYDLSGLKGGQTPPESLVREVEGARLLFASTLRRAIETAEAASGGREFDINSIFVEAPLPPPRMPGRFPARTWGVFARCSWWLGMSRGRESRVQAERRAEQAADILIEAAQTGPVVLFAHGWFNRMLRPVLRRRGWQCVRDGGDNYWSWRRYELKQRPSTERGA